MGPLPLPERRGNLSEMGLCNSYDENQLSSIMTISLAATSGSFDVVSDIEVLG
jgi:hypothetical protein